MPQWSKDSKASHPPASPLPLSSVTAAPAAPAAGPRAGGGTVSPQLWSKGALVRLWEHWQFPRKGRNRLWMQQRYNVLLGAWNFV